MSRVLTRGRVVDAWRDGLVTVALDPSSPFGRRFVRCEAGGDRPAVGAVVGVELEVEGEALRDGLVRQEATAARIIGSRAPEPTADRDYVARRALADRVRQAAEEAVASVASWPRGRDAPDELAAAVSAVVLASDLRAPAPHVAPPSSSYATGPDAALPPPSGEVDGWRWWVVDDDGEESWLAYDNRPQLDEWDARFVTIAMQQHVSRRPTLVQGKVPMSVVRAAVGS